MHRPRLFTSQHPLVRRGRDVGFGALGGALSVPILSALLSDDAPAQAATTTAATAKAAPLGPAQAAHNAAQAALTAPKPTGVPTPTPTSGPSGAEQMFDFMVRNGDQLMWFAIMVCLLLGVAIFLVNSQGGISGRSGLASRGQLRRGMARRAIYREAKRTTPSLQVSRSERRKIPVSHYAVYLGKAAEYWAMKLHTSYRDVCMLVGPPQTGKTALLGHWVLDAPGCVVTTSTKTDIYNMTHQHRQKFGRVLMFNPEGLGGRLSDFRWNPLTGCEHPDVAEERATALVNGGGNSKDLENEGFWNGEAADLLKYYMHAAAISGKPFSQIWQWVQKPDDRAFVTILRTHEDAEPGWGDSAAGVFNGPEKTVKSVFITLRHALKFMANATAAASTEPEPGMPDFDIDAFLESQDTLYLVGANKRKGGVAPLFSCFTTALFNRAKHLASFKPPYERHDPVVSFILDEAALICPVPIDEWAADSGGRGIWIAWTVQSMGQVETIYGPGAATTLRDASNTWIILPGLKDDDFLEKISKLCGKKDVKVQGAETKGQDGTTMSRSTSIRREEIMPVDRIREMRDNQALIIRRNIRPTLVNYTPVWERKEVKGVTQAAKAAAVAGYDPSEFDVPLQRQPQPAIAIDRDGRDD